MVATAFPDLLDNLKAYTNGRVQALSDANEEELRECVLACPHTRGRITMDLSAISEFTPDE
jgi:hypothetical protein